MIKAIFSPDDTTKLRMQGLAQCIILLIAFTVFLPYQVTASVILGTGLLFCVLPGVRDKIFAQKKVFITFGFLLLTATVAL